MKVGLRPVEGAVTGPEDAGGGQRRIGNRILVVSPSIRGGSWRWIEEAISASRIRGRVDVLAYGAATDVHLEGVRKITLPFFSYERFGFWMSRHPAVLVVYNLPLIAALYIVLVTRRPKTIVVNGVLLSVAALPYAKVAGAKVILAYHSYMGMMSETRLLALRRCLAGISAAYVNSVGSLQDLSSILDREKIRVVEHWADDVYFSGSLPEPRTGHLRVLYVGRQDEEKAAGILSVIELCGTDSGIEFVFAGDGPYASLIRDLSRKAAVSQLGYVSDKERLAEVYRKSDILWGLADDTYVAKPVVEALACGVPSVIPRRSAVWARQIAGVSVPDTLVSAPTGWLVDDGRPDAVRELLLELRDSDRTSWPAQCRALAVERYSAKNILAFAADLSS